MTESRQKTLKQAYKLAMPPMGIYALRNIATGRTLFDGSRNLTGALNRHRFELRQGVHRNRALQADWQRYGEAGFAFEIVERIEQKAEADFDYAAELAVLLELWREKLPLGAENSYL
jgi:hypothetical protein